MVSKPMTVRELIEELARLDPELPINVFTADGDYGTPQVAAVTKHGAIERVTVTAKEDD